jgi:hypothetical protein
MSKITLKTVNKTLKEEGIPLELQKGPSYFYFTGYVLDLSDSTSVMVNSLNQLTLGEWIEEAQSLIKE